MRQEYYGILEDLAAAGVSIADVEARVKRLVDDLGFNRAALITGQIGEAMSHWNLAVQTWVALESEMMERVNGSV